MELSTRSKHSERPTMALVNLIVTKAPVSEAELTDSLFQSKSQQSKYHRANVRFTFGLLLFKYWAFGYGASMKQMKMSRRVWICHDCDDSIWRKQCFLLPALKPEHGESRLHCTLSSLHQSLPPRRHQDDLVGRGRQTTPQLVGAAWAQLAWGLPPLLRQINYRREPLDAEDDRGPRSCCSPLQDSGAQPGQALPSPGPPRWDGGSGGGALSGTGPDHGGGRSAEGRRHSLQIAQHCIR